MSRSSLDSVWAEGWKLGYLAVYLHRRPMLLYLRKLLTCCNNLLFITRCLILSKNNLDSISTEPGAAITYGPSMPARFNPYKMSHCLRRVILQGNPIHVIHTFHCWTNCLLSSCNNNSSILGHKLILSSCNNILFSSNSLHPLFILQLCLQYNMCLSLHHLISVSILLWHLSLELFISLWRSNNH